MKLLLYLLIVALAVPVGLLIRKMAREEIVTGAKWIRGLFVACLVLVFVSIFYLPVYFTLTFLFMAIVSFMSVAKYKR